MDFAKTKFLSTVLEPYFTERLALVTGFDPCPNFTKAASNIPNLTVKNPQTFNLLELIRSDLIFFTRDGLAQFEMVLESRMANAFRNRQVPTS